MLRYIIVFLIGFSCGSIGTAATWEQIKEMWGAAEPVVEKTVDVITDQ